VRPLSALLAVMLVFSALPLLAAETRDRVALVIGNSRYDHLPSLVNPHNDAKGIAAALWQAGFETIELLDADRQQMIAAIATFAKRIDSDTDAVFFYAGHGVQSRGSNYLLPVDTRLEDADDLAARVIDANEIVGWMAQSDGRINVVILDACHDNPFAEVRSTLAAEIAAIDPALLGKDGDSPVVVRSAAGLAPINAGRAETVVGYSTGPGEVALDGKGDNSPYTWALLQHLNTPGLEIDMLFRRVRAEVREATDGRQIPWLTSTLESQFYFRPLATDAAMTMAEAQTYRDEDTRRLGLAPPTQLVEEAFWRIVVTSARQGDYEAYLQRYPDGRFANDAREQLAVFAAGGTPPSTTVTDDEGTQIAYLGVGPVALDFSGELELPDDAVGLQVVSIPTSGMVFRRDETRVLPGHLLARSDLDGLRFLPRIGTKSTGVREALRLLPLIPAGDATEHEHWLESVIHPCDLLAGLRYAPDRVWDGVQQAILELDPLPAVEACEQAAGDYPEIVRFAALLARANRAAKRWPEAIEWAKSAADRGYATGMSQLGTIYMRGTGVEPDYRRARALFDQGVALNESTSALRIGEMLEAGWGQPADPAAAADWYARALERGDAYAGTRLARLHEEGRGVARDPARAVELYEQAAAAGELSARLRLARIRLDRDSAFADGREGLQLLEAAAGTGMPEGQKALGRYYLEEQQSGGDLDKAIYWLEQASERGDAWAPLYLGRLHLEDEKAGIDPPRAAKWLQIAVERGNGAAARALAKLYETDALGTPDLARAVAFHRMAAEEGDIWSMRDLAKALLAGEGAGRDVEAGLTWMRLAADGGNPWASRDLGRTLARGEQIDRDPVSAALYLGLAAGSSDEGAAQSARDLLVSLLDEEERVEATQTWLNELGFDAGIADGRNGPTTRAAARAWLKGRGLDPKLEPGSVEMVTALAATMKDADGAGTSRPGSEEDDPG